jgi:hypothetical protein
LPFQERQTFRVEVPLGPQGELVDAAVGSEGDGSQRFRGRKRKADGRIRL